MQQRIIVLFRHPQTRLSRGKRLIGQCDVQLNDEGIAYAQKAGMVLAKYRFDHLFSSALLRTKQMADILSGHTGLDVKANEGINEIDLGAWDGRFIEDIGKEYPVEYQSRGDDIIHYRPPGGENFVDLKNRVLPAYRNLLQNSGNIVIVAHASVNRVILAEAQDTPIDNILSIKQNYGCCNILLQNENDYNVQLINGSLDNLDKALKNFNIGV